MVRFVLLAAMALGVMSGPAIAETMTVKAPLEAATVKSDDLDMVAYFRELDGDVLEVTATFAEREGFYRPARVVMGLEQDARVAFSVPGFPETLYRVSRRDGALTVSVERIEFIEVAQID
ncbi:MAG: hypothetical protein AAFV19_15255 [Pseudomonadota bacterium]